MTHGIRYMTLEAALRDASAQLAQGALLQAGERRIDLYDLMDSAANDATPTDLQHYFVVRDDGSVGFTRDAGTTVDWLYLAVEGPK